MSIIEAIEARAQELGMDTSELAKTLGLTEPYWRAFRRGGRWIGLVGHEKLKFIAEFVGLPLVTVYVMAGIFSPEDFYKQRTLEARLDEVFEQVKLDTYLKAYCPSDEDWENTPLSVKYLALLMHNKLTETDLLLRGNALQEEESDTRKAV